MQYQRRNATDWASNPLPTPKGIAYTAAIAVRCGIPKLPTLPSLRLPVIVQLRQHKAQHGLVTHAFSQRLGWVSQACIEFPQY